MKAITKVSIIMAKLFQFYIVFTIAHIVDDGFNQNNIIMLLFNLAYIISFQTYDNKINSLYEQRGKYFSKSYYANDAEVINKTNKEICKTLFEDIFDGDFRE